MTDNKIYEGGKQATREAMKDAFVSGDWSGWSYAPLGTENWRGMSKCNPGLIDSNMYQFRRKPRTMTINGVKVPVPNKDGYAIELYFETTEQADKFYAAIRKAMEGGE